MCVLPPPCPPWVSAKSTSSSSTCFPLRPTTPGRTCTHCLSCDQRLLATGMPSPLRSTLATRCLGECKPTALLLARDAAAPDHGFHEPSYELLNEPWPADLYKVRLVSSRHPMPSHILSALAHNKLQTCMAGLQHPLWMLDPAEGLKNNLMPLYTQAYDQIRKVQLGRVH